MRKGEMQLFQKLDYGLLYWANTWLLNRNQNLHALVFTVFFKQYYSPGPSFYVGWLDSCTEKSAYLAFCFKLKLIIDWGRIEFAYRIETFKYREIVCELIPNFQKFVRAIPDPGSIRGKEPESKMARKDLWPKMAGSQNRNFDNSCYFAYQIEILN